MKYRSLFLSFACLLATVSFTACDDDDDDDDGDEVTSGIMILNEGVWGGNDASIVLYDPETKAVGSDIYNAQNGKGLGDVGQDMIAYNNRVYVTVSNSMRLVKLDRQGKELKCIDFPADDNQPRYMVAEDGFIYVSLYGGKVAKIDTATLDIQGYVTVGANPEQMVEENGKLYVTNSGWGAGTTVSVINLSNFTKEKDITVGANPNLIVEANDDVYVISYGANCDDYKLQRLSDNGCEDLDVTATRMAEHDGIIYLANSVTDWTTYVTTNTFFSYNANTKKKIETSFLNLTGAATKLTSSSVCMMEIDPNNGDIYIGAYKSFSDNGDVYRFSSTGDLIDHFDSHGKGPNNAVFFKK